MFLGENLRYGGVQLDSQDNAAEENWHARGREAHDNARAFRCEVHKRGKRAVDAALASQWVGDAANTSLVFALDPSLGGHAWDDIQRAPLTNRDVHSPSFHAVFYPALANHDQGGQKEQAEHIHSHHGHTHEHPELAEGLQAAREVREEAKGRSERRRETTFPRVHDHPRKPLALVILQMRAMFPKIVKHEDHVNVDHRDEEKRQERRHSSVRGGRQHVCDWNRRKDYKAAPEGHDYTPDVAPHVDRDESDRPDRPPDVHHER
mmetsp:Transcript_44456/g.123007  ORF Transcript_44456/g.123007 Transcript_44456/m.123007 type:complete len:263 (+) Transcript_44456:760-1548(+)